MAAHPYPNRGIVPQRVNCGCPCISQPCDYSTKSQIRIKELLQFKKQTSMIKEDHLLAAIKVAASIRGHNLSLHGFVKKEQLEDALTHMELLIIPVGVHRKLAMTRDNLFNINPDIVRAL